MIALHGQSILILGLGASGLAMARWCARHGAQVTVADTRNEPPQLATLRAEVPDAVFVPGVFTDELLQGQTIRAVFCSPGLAPKDTASVLQAAQAMGLWVGGELSLFAQALADLQATTSYAPQVLAITGTNGKTTVTSLTGQLIARTGKTVAVAGNIGPTLLDTLTNAQQQSALPQVWVLELSSFQLESCQNFEPTAAVVLNLSQDHLDWHGSMQHYANAKAKVFGQTATMIVNRDDPLVMVMLPAPVKGKSPRQYTTFGANLPQRPGDFGLEEVNGMVWLVRAQESDETRKKRRDTEELFIQRLMPADALRIRGRHNACNALAALALCAAAGCNLAPVLYGLRDYRGEPHRVEPVAVVNGVEYFDDSKGTNVGATVAALNGLGPDRKIVLILGGDGKGQDFSPLLVPVQRFVRAMVLLGRDAPQIRQALSAAEVPMLDVDSMEQAVQCASQQAQSGDVVLMSPACASLDMFRNYEHRAHVFCGAVRQLALEQGEALEGSV